MFPIFILPFTQLDIERLLYLFSDHLEIFDVINWHFTSTGNLLAINPFSFTAHVRVLFYQYFHKQSYFIFYTTSFLRKYSVRVYYLN